MPVTVVVSYRFYDLVAAAVAVTPGGQLREVGRLADLAFIGHADVLDRLARDGWAVRVFGDHAEAQHEDVAEERQARLRLKVIGVGPGSANVVTTWEDWFAAP